MRRGIPAWSGLATLAASGIGSAVAVWVLFSDAPFPPEADQFTSTGAYVLWVVLTVGEVGLWAALLLALIPTMRELMPPKDDYGMLIWPVLLGVGFFAVLVLLLVSGRRLGETLPAETFVNPFPGHGAKLGGIGIFGSLVAAVATIGMGLVHVRLDRIASSGRVAGPEDVDAFLRLRQLLHRLLVVEAVILGSAIFSLAALRGAIEAIDTLEFPQELLIGYGLAGSAALAAVYAPVYGRVLDVGRRFLDAASPVEPGSGHDLWSERLEKRAKLESLLRIDTSIGTNLQATLAILTPVLSSVIGAIVGIQ